jgi:hypothetical protein
MLEKLDEVKCMLNGKEMLMMGDRSDKHLRRPDMRSRVRNIKLRFRSIGKHFAVFILKPALEIAQITGFGNHFFFQWDGFD